MGKGKFDQLFSGESQSLIVASLSEMLKSLAPPVRESLQVPRKFRPEFVRKPGSGVRRSRIGHTRNIERKHGWHHWSLRRCLRSRLSFVLAYALQSDDF